MLNYPPPRQLDKSFARFLLNLQDFVHIRDLEGQILFRNTSFTRDSEFQAVIDSDGFENQSLHEIEKQVVESNEGVFGIPLKYTQDSVAGSRYFSFDCTVWADDESNTLGCIISLLRRVTRLPSVIKF